MGYACPVCGTPQADARHLANHLAFTAMLHGDDHEAWLDEHSPGWATDGERALAARVRAFATDTEYPQVFEDTAGGLEETHDQDTPADRSGMIFDEGEPPQPSGSGRDVAELDPETRETLEAARELTRRRHEGDEED